MNDLPSRFLKKARGGGLVGLRVGCVVTIALLLACQVGCDGPSPIETRTEVKPRRMLVAILVPAERDRVWFVKLDASTATVGRLEDDFSSFVRSVRVDPDSGELVWELPSAWTAHEFSEEEQPPAFQVGTFDVDRSQDPRQVTVSVLKLNPDESLESYFDRLVARWREQLGLPELSGDQAMKQAQAKTEALDGLELTMLDMYGRQPDGAEQNLPGARKRPSAAGASEAGIGFDIPQGWRRGPNNVISSLRFLIGEGDGAAEVTVSRAGGGWDANAIRWAGQVGDESVTAQSLADKTESIVVDGTPSQWIELTSTDGREPAQGMLGARVPGSQGAWFIKLVGPADSVTDERVNFRNFLSSLDLPETP